MKKKKQLLVDFLCELRNKGIADLHHEMTETIVKSFLKQRKKENKIASKLKIKDLERQLASKELNKTWRKGAMAKILKNQSNHGFILGDEVIVLHPDSFQAGNGWQCYSESSGSVYWIMEKEAELVG
jgi:hypothetical protein